MRHPANQKVSAVLITFWLQQGKRALGKASGFLPLVDGLLDLRELPSFTSRHTWDRPGNGAAEGSGTRREAELFGQHRSMTLPYTRVSVSSSCQDMQMRAGESDLTQPAERPQVP